MRFVSIRTDLDQLHSIGAVSRTDQLQIDLEVPGPFSSLFQAKSNERIASQWTRIDVWRSQYTLLTKSN